MLFHGQVTGQGRGQGHGTGDIPLVVILIRMAPGHAIESLRAGRFSAGNGEVRKAGRRIINPVQVSKFTYSGQST